jgi:17beta-estradiol 17-dehydrogenase / very-long-chain 3-oxoacyl-CoA reductase
VTALFNNVGMSHGGSKLFEKENLQVMMDMLTVNVSSAIKITKLVLPHLIAQKNGLIVNTGSGAGIMPAVGMSIYGPTKKFMSTWSQALAQEVQGHGVTVINLETLFVYTNMTKARFSGPSRLVPDAHNYVAWIIAKLGLAGGSIYPHSMAHHPVHVFGAFVITRCLPAFVLDRMSYRMAARLRKMEKSR